MDNQTKHIIKYSYPVYIGYTLMLFYNVADVIIISKLIGKNALAAVGSVSTIMFVIQGYLLGFSHGFSAIASHKLGKNDLNSFKKTVGNAAFLSLVGSILMSMALISSMPLLLKLLNVRESIYRYAYNYIITICFGIIIMSAYNLIGALLCAVKKSKLIVVLSAVMLFVNVTLDYLFIKFFKLSTQGAALATLTGFLVSTIIACFYIINKEPQLHIKTSDLKPNKTIIKQLLKSGIPMSLSHSAKGIGAAFVQSAFNTFSINHLAAVSVFYKIYHLSTDAFCAIGNATCNLCAKNIGKGDRDSAKKAIKSGVAVSLFVSFITSAFLILFCKYFTPIFVTKNVAAVSKHLVTLTNTVAPFLFLLAITITLRYSLFGLKLSYLAAASGIAELIARIIMSVISKTKSSFTFTALSFVVSWAVAAAVLLLIYFKLVNKYLKK